MASKPTLHSFCGKAGAGKSTLAAKLAADLPAMLICEDVWLARLYGEEMKTFDDYRRVAQRLKSVVGPLAVACAGGLRHHRHRLETRVFHESPGRFQANHAPSPVVTYNLCVARVAAT